MKSPILFRGEYEGALTSLLLELDSLRKRIKDLERQFAIEYDDAGKVTKTLADVPVTERANVKVIRRPKHPTAGMSWPQRREWLERTEGGRKLNG